MSISAKHSSRLVQERLVTCTALIRVVSSCKDVRIERSLVHAMRRNVLAIHVDIERVVRETTKCDVLTNFGRGAGGWDRCVTGLVFSYTLRYIIGF